MSIAHVRYTVKAEYAPQNKANINRVMEELRALKRDDITYRVFLDENGKSFTHTLILASEEAGDIFRSLKTFQAFQAALAASQPEVSPVASKLTLVGSSSDTL